MDRLGTRDVSDRRPIPTFAMKTYAQFGNPGRIGQNVQPRAVEASERSDESAKTVLSDRMDVLETHAGSSHVLKMLVLNGRNGATGPSATNGAAAGDKSDIEIA